HTPNAESPNRWRMNGDRKIPTNILFPKANQLEPMFLMICRFSTLCIDAQLPDISNSHFPRARAGGDQPTEELSNMLDMFPYQLRQTRHDAANIATKRGGDNSLIGIKRCQTPAGESVPRRCFATRIMP